MLGARGPRVVRARRSVSGVFLAALLVATAVRAGDSASYLDELTVAADAAGLAADPEWLALLHYEPL
ncbi:MAG: hypothetical protein ABI629_25740, partial [bacterium]